MPAATFILATVLADSDDFGWVKLLPFAIGLVIWIFGVLASKSQKAERERRQRQASEAFQPPPAARQAMTPAYAPPPVPRRHVPPPPVPRSKTKHKQKPGRRAPQPAQALPSEAAPPLPSSPEARGLPTPSTTRGATPAGITARDIAKWLRPEVMRRQFILTEVFDPPPGLRPPEQDA